MKKGIKEHWHVEKGELVSDGHDPYLATTKDFGDFEMWVDWKIGPDGRQRHLPPRRAASPNLGSLQRESETARRRQRLRRPLEQQEDTNDSRPSWPTIPIGEWNRMYIRMVGPYVTVKLNDKKVVDNVIMENYYDPKIPVFSRGPIYLQTHGTETRFRNVFVREIPAEESNRILSEIKGDHADFKPLFNGKDLSGWKGATEATKSSTARFAVQGGHTATFCTNDTYDNFVVRLEFKLPPGGNNGLAIRTPDVDRRCRLRRHGTANPRRHRPDMYKDLHDYQFHGSLYGLAPARRGFLRPVGEWNYRGSHRRRRPHRRRAQRL